MYLQVYTIFASVHEKTGVTRPTSIFLIGTIHSSQNYTIYSWADTIICNNWNYHFSMILHATVVHIMCIRCARTYQGILYNMASKCWMASLNFALVIKGCCLPIRKHSDGLPFCKGIFLWFVCIHARNHMSKYYGGLQPPEFPPPPTSYATQTISLK